MTLAQGYLQMKIKTCISQKPLGHFLPNFVCTFLDTRKHDAGHMTKMVAMQTWYNNLKIIFAGTWANFDETWYEASETQAHYILSK